MTLPPKPTALEVWHRNTPAALKEVEGWILWKYTLVNGKWTKPPFNEDGKKIDAHDPTEWMTFSQAVQAYQRGGFDGIGLSLNAMEALAGVDLDHCVKGGEIEPWALEIVSELGSYVEISPSGEGLRILGYGKLRREGRKKGNVEVYDGGRYLTITGHRLDSATYDIEDFDEALNRVHRRVWAETPKAPTAHSSEKKVGVDLAERFAALCDDDPKFKDRYYSPASVGDRSDHEFHLCARLWEEGFSEAEIRSLMDSSPQEKWRERGADDYRDTTIRRAIQSAAASPKTTRRGRKKEDPAKLLEILEGKLSEDPDVIQDPTVKKMLATYRRLDAVGYESLLKRVGIRGDLKKALGSDLKHIDDDGEKTGKGPSMATRIVNLALASGATFWRSPDSEAFVTILCPDGHLENLLLKSKAAKTWLSGLLFKAEGKAPKGSAVADALAVLEGRATFEGEVHPVFTRLAEHDDKYYLDLGGDDWRAVEIGPDGWRLISSEAVPVKFRRSKGFLELPEPTTDGSLEDLRRVMNVPTGDPWVLTRGWLAQAFRPVGPYPPMIVTGEQGSGKSWLARILRYLLDPNKAALRRPPRNEQELMIAANNSWLVAFDNLSGLPPWLADALCVISTGGGFGVRELYTDADEALFDVQRPVILNGIDALTTRGDILGRAILIDLPRIKASDRKTEKEIKAELERIRPGVLGAILDAVSCGLKELPNVKLDSMPRMADFAEWVTACEKGLGLKKGEFLAAFNKNQDESKKALIDNDMFATSLKEHVLWALEKSDEPLDITAGLLLETLEARSNITTKTRPDGWPRSPRGASGKVRRLAPALRAYGIDVSELPREATARKLRFSKCGDIQTQLNSTVIEPS